MKFKAKPSLTGGYHKRKKLTLSSSRAIELLIEQHGGPTKVADLIGINHQSIINARRQGHMPLKSAGPLARKLSKEPYYLFFVLNYKDTGLFTGIWPDWKEVVDNVFQPRDARYILEGAHPKCGE